MGWLGANHIMRRKNRDRLRIFTLHGVADYDAPADWVPLRDQMHVVKLDAMLGKLCKKYRFLPIEQAVRMINGVEPAMENCAVLTFDDGYRNNFSVALPVLKKHRIPATFYIATDFVESRRPYWFDRLDYVIQKASKQQLCLRVRDHSFKLEDSERDKVREVYAQLRKFVKKEHNEEREFLGILNRLGGELESMSGTSLAEVIEGDPWTAVSSTNEIADAARDDLVTIGSHTVNHLRLACAEIDEVRRELRMSKAKLQEWTGSDVRHFAYPNGEYDAQSMREVEAAGYDSAVTSFDGMNSIGCNVFALSRQNLSPNSSVSEMLARASGLEDAVVGAIRALKGQRSSGDRARVNSSDITAY